MKHDPKFRFMADTTTAILDVRRRFAAPRQLVWDCHTRSELLDRWFAPKPMTTRTASMEFREGGHWHHAMIAEDGTEYWGIVRYDTIDPIDGYTTTDFFSDPSGTPNEDLPASSWVVRFTEDGADATLVHSRITYASPEDLQTVIDMGMEEGMASTFEKLDETLASLTS